MNRILHRFVDVKDSNEIVKIVTRDIGLSYVDMETHVEIRNKFFVPYHLEEVRLTYYNDANQNIGYLHFEGPVRIGAYRNEVVKMPSKMSNITALFNGVRLLVSDNIKTRTVGITRIRLFGMSFEFPIDDVMIVNRDKIVSEELTEEEQLRRREIREKRDAERHRKKAERKAKREARQAEMEARRAWKQRARKRLKNIRQIRRDRDSASAERPDTDKKNPGTGGPDAI